MVYFQTKKILLWVKFWRALEWKMLVYFTAIWNNLRPFGIFYGRLVHFVVNWYILHILVHSVYKNLATLVQSTVEFFNKNIFRTFLWSM
jgi:hypothetical protein